MDAQATTCEAELPCAAQGHRNDAVLEGEGGVVDGVVLNIELRDPKSLGKPVALDQRGEAHHLADGRRAINRQQFAVSPHALRARRKNLAADILADGLVIVGGLQGTKVILANMNGLLLVKAPTFAAFEVGKERAIFVHDWPPLESEAR